MEREREEREAKTRVQVMGDDERWGGVVDQDERKRRVGYSNEEERSA